MNGVIILGASGLSKEFFHYIKRSKPTINEFIFVNDLDDGQHTITIEGVEYPVVKDWKFDVKYEFIVAVGNPKIKQILIKKAIESGLSPMETIIDPAAIVLTDRKNIGVGGMISPGCVVTTDIKIGDYVTLNLNTTVGHDTTIGDYCTTNPGVHLSGEIKIGESNEFGTGSILRDRITIGSNKTFGAQTAVVKSIDNDINEVYVGVPSKKLIK